VADDVTTLRSCVPSLRSRVSVDEVAGEDQLGANAADTAATTEEVQSGAPVVTAVPAVVSGADQSGANPSSPVGPILKEYLPVSSACLTPEP
jgi:hypothetical protein